MCAQAKMYAFKGGVSAGVGLLVWGKWAPPLASCNVRACQDLWPFRALQSQDVMFMSHQYSITGESCCPY